MTPPTVQPFKRSSSAPLASHFRRRVSFLLEQAQDVGRPCGGGHFVLHHVRRPDQDRDESRLRALPQGSRAHFYMFGRGLSILTVPRCLIFGVSSIQVQEGVSPALGTSSIVPSGAVSTRKSGRARPQPVLTVAVEIYARLSEKLTSSWLCAGLAASPACVLFLAVLGSPVLPFRCSRCIFFDAVTRKITTASD